VLIHLATAPAVRAAPLPVPRSTSVP